MDKFPTPPESNPHVVFPNCRAADILSLEAKLKTELPEDYKQYLLEHNGIIFPNVYTSKNRGARGRIKVGVLYGIAPDGNPVTYDIARAQLGYDFTRRVPSGIVQIGQSISGYHAVCISTRDEDHGSIYLWDPQLPWEEREEDNVPTMAYLKRVTRSFSAFWKSLRVKRSAS